MATRPPLHQGTPRSSRKPYQRMARTRTVVSTQAIKRAKRIKVRDLFTCQNKRCNRVTDQLEVDHRVALEFGGEDNDGNCRCLCKPCHEVKSKLESHGMQVADPDSFATTYREAKREAVAFADADAIDVMKLFTSCSHVVNKE